MPLITYFTHALDFVNPNWGVDLHWKFSAQFTHRLDYDAIWRQKCSFMLRGRNFMVLSDEHEIVFHLISIFKELEMGMARLRAFVDLYFVLEKIGHDVDWELVSRAARARADPGRLAYSPRRVPAVFRLP